MKKIRIVLFVLFVCLCAGFARGQAADGTAYFLPNLPQRVRLNPAYQPEYKVWVGLPALGGISAGYTNSSLGLNDLFVKKTNDSLYVDMERMYKSLRKQNVVHFGAGVSLLTVGVRLSSWYATLDVTEKNDFTFRAGKELFAFLKDGNAPYWGKTMDIGDFGMQLNAYNEFALGVSKKLGDKWTVGGRAKFLTGVASARMNSSLSLESTDTSLMKIRSKQDIRLSAPVTLDYVPDGEGYINWGGVNSSMNNFSLSTLLNVENPGFALDLGAEYQFSDKLKFYASVVDLGFIRWGATSHSFTQDAEFDWQGGDLSGSLEEGGKPMGDVFGDLVDTLKNKFRLKAAQGAYTSMLRAKMYLGATYQVLDKVNVAGVAGLTLLDNVLYPSLTASADVRLLRNVSAALSYSVMPGNYVNLGAALTAKLGPVQLYASTDNALVTTGTRSLNAHVGVNLLFGHKDKKKKDKHENQPAPAAVTPVKRVSLLRKQPEVEKDTVEEETDIMEETAPEQSFPTEAAVVAPTNTVTAAVAEKENWHVIVGGFKDRRQAESLRNKMKQMGFKDALILPHTEGWFRVSCMSFGSHDEAWDKVFEIREKYPEYRNTWALKVD